MWLNFSYLDTARKIQKTGAIQAHISPDPLCGTKFSSVKLNIDVERKPGNELGQIFMPEIKIQWNMDDECKANETKTYSNAPNHEI